MKLNDNNMEFKQDFMEDLANLIFESAKPRDVIPWLETNLDITILDKVDDFKDEVDFINKDVNKGSYTNTELLSNLIYDCIYHNDLNHNYVKASRLMP